MYLKSLVLKGFKSFADRSVLSLEPGMTVVVGPNGSGKSNISDAVLWVLGEQKARQLRGQAMEDVIFAGSSARQAVSLAEVDLVLDNSDGTLPLDFNEVVITRRMYRSGESEYLINGSPSRLMDILDLLNDCGLGRDTHSIISQGSLQSMLQARPEDRRVLIEEAAGILKHKKRKERSTRKLANMDNELARVNDIAAEIDRQLKPLERQASRAQTYEALSAELKDLELTLAVDDLRSLQNEWKSIESKEKEADSLVELARFRLNEKNKELEKFQRLLEEKGLFVGDLAEQRRRCQSALERLDSGMFLLEEKGRNMVSRLSELRQTIHRSDTRSVEAKTQYDASLKECDDTVARREALHSELSRLQKESEDIRKQRKAADQNLSQINSSIRGREKAIEDCQLKTMKANESLSSAKTEDELLARRLKQIEDSFAATQTTLGSRRGHLEELDKQLNKLERDSTLAKADIDKRVRLLDDERKKLNESRDAHNAVRAEIQELEEVDRAFDAASPMLSWILEHREEFEGIISPLSEIITAPPELEALVEHLLGADIFGLMMEDVASAEKLIDTILENGVEGGEISLVSLKDTGSQRLRAKSGERLLDKLKVPIDYLHAADVLLGDVYLVDSVADALKAAEDDISSSRFVTPDGVVVNPNGKITFGIQIADAEGVLARKRRLLSLKDEEPKLVDAISEAEYAVSQAENNLQLAQADGFEISQSVAQITGEADSLREEIGRLEQTITTMLQEKAEINNRREAVESETITARALVADLSGRKEAFEKELAGFEEELAQATEKRSTLFEEETELSKSISTTQVEMATVRERELHLNKDIESLKRELRNLTNSLQVSRDTERSLEILRLRVEPLHDAFSTLRELVTEKAELLRDQANLEQAGQGDLRDTIEEARKNVADHQGKVEQAQESLTAVRIEKSRLEVKVENAIRTITEDHGVLLDIALEVPEPQDRKQTEDKAVKLRRKIAHLGNVNPVAIEEYRDLKDRRDFIASQVQDLEGARKSLERIVAAIDRKLRNRFIETFETVNDNFEEIFGILFPGGKGSLILTDPEHPEETGVEVHAQPRGKTVRKQSLLSGGEQSLVSLALMFAVYRVRTTPFYILDEVEAALDDTNLRRLLSYLDSMRHSTQVIMISHQRRTMELADLLYGVSMRSDGVSKLVSQRLDQALKQASDAPQPKDIDSFSGAQ